MIEDGLKWIWYETGSGTEFYVCLPDVCKAQSSEHVDPLFTELTVICDFSLQHYEPCGLS